MAACQASQACREDNDRRLIQVQMESDGAEVTLNEVNNGCRAAGRRDSAAAEVTGIHTPDNHVQCLQRTTLKNEKIESE